MFGPIVTTLLIVSDPRIAALGSQSYAERDAAERSLSQDASAHFAVRCAMSSRDPEIARRAGRAWDRIRPDVAVKWTSHAPTTAGTYWWRSGPGSEPQKRLIRRHGDYVAIEGYELDSIADLGGEWGGPIVPATP